MKIPFVDLKVQYSSIKDEIDQAIFNVIQDSAFIGGKYAKAFEQSFADYIGVKNCVGVGNGTDALYIALKALEISEGDDVITVANSFIATSEAITMTGARVVFVDCNRESYNIDVDSLEQAITGKTKAIIPVHLYGQPAEMDKIKDVAKKHGLYIIEDAAQAHGAEYQGQRIGTIGDMACFSFFPGKNLGAYGDAGAIVTNDDELAAKIRLMKNFGFGGYDNVIYIGTNGKMSEVSAAMGLTGLESLEEFIATNYRNYKAYKRELEGIPGVQLVTYNETEKCNYQYIVLEIDEAVTRVSRNQLVEILHAENVLARRYFYPGCHRMEPYRSYFPHAGLLLPETEKLVKRVLSLPTGTAVSVNDIATICLIIRLSVENALEVSQRLQASKERKV